MFNLFCNYYLNLYMKCKLLIYVLGKDFFFGKDFFYLIIIMKIFKLDGI